MLKNSDKSPRAVWAVSANLNVKKALTKVRKHFFEVLVGSTSFELVTPAV
jgi:hypothetical protein